MSFRGSLSATANGCTQLLGERNGFILLYCFHDIRSRIRVLHNDVPFRSQYFARRLLVATVADAKLVSVTDTGVDDTRVWGT